ncbi:MAG TPA: MaoC family dehydratase N-terminal domain-containing protein, partial [Asanoa sp.]|nr:MaoC family dehydratase N-terminal domain-containing protein [Asanoa sp.]
MPDEQTTVSDAMRAAVGRELGRRVSYPVTDSDIRRWAIAVHYPQQPPARYWDEDSADRTGHHGVVAPLDFNPFAWLSKEPGYAEDDGIDANDPDRTEKTLGIAGPGLRFQLNGGMSVAYGVRMRPGDTITS